MIDIHAIQQEFHNHVTTCADALVEKLDSCVEKLNKITGGSSVVVLDACDCDMWLPNAAIEEAESLMGEEICKSWKLNSCKSKEEIEEIIAHTYLFTNGRAKKNIVLYYENHAVRKLLDDHFPSLPAVRCPEDK